MYTLQDAIDIIDIEVDRSNLIVAIEAFIEAWLKSDILVFFAHILWKKKLLLFLRQATWRRKLNQMQESLEHDIFWRVEEFDSIFVRFPRWEISRRRSTFSPSFPFECNLTFTLGNS